MGGDGGSGAAKEAASEQVTVVLQERQVKAAEELNVLVVHFELFGRVPVYGLGVGGRRGWWRLREC